MTGDETLQSYWSRAIHIQTRLNGINMNIPDTTLQTWLLRGLPPAYDNYGDIATNHAGADVDIYALLAFLQVHEVKHHVKQAQSAAGGVLRAFSRKCYSCGSEQHTAAMCPARLATHPGRVSVFQRISSLVHCGQVLPYLPLPLPRQSGSEAGAGVQAGLEPESTLWSCLHNIATLLPSCRGE